jgi:N6-adenosine-specific RNA methylase IME4/ParB-like chromosome segregation protein Spo0J
MPELFINPDLRNLIPQLQRHELKQLEASILAEGCRDALVVWKGRNILLDGHNRYEICEKHGIPFRTTEIEFDNEGSAKVWIIKNQFGRRNLTPYQRAELALAMGGLLKEEARKRQLASLKQNTVVPNSAQRKEGKTHGRTDEELAKIAGIGKDTIQKSRRIVEKVPEPVKEQLRRGELSINAAHKDLRQVERAKRKAQVIEQLQREPEPFPIGPFRVIVVDPPWRYNCRSQDATHRGRTPFPDMCIEEICRLPVAGLAYKDCVLWLWTTNSFMREAYRCLDAWGFTAKTILTWDKVSMGVGNWLRNVTEHCILAVKGHPIVNLSDQTTLITEKRREHSRKPETFYGLVESLCPGSKLELFARCKREGWTAWGVEKDFFNDMEGTPNAA